MKARGCHQVPNKFKDASGRTVTMHGGVYDMHASGHTVTTGLRVVEHDGLRKQRLVGTTLRSDYEQSKFVDTSAAESEEIQTLGASIEHYIARCCEISKIPPCLFSEGQWILLEKSYRKDTTA